jgi:hypothetical protein
MERTVARQEHIDRIHKELGKYNPNTFGEAFAEIDDFILVVHIALKHRYGIGLANVMAKQMLDAECKPKFKGVW